MFQPLDELVHKAIKVFTQSKRNEKFPGEIEQELQSDESPSGVKVTTKFLAIKPMHVASFFRPKINLQRCSLF